MWQRVLRCWIWRGNAVLACALIAVSAWALQNHDLDVRGPQSVPELVLSDGFRFEPSVSRAELDQHVAVVRRFHGQDRPRVEAALNVATEPPLSAYRVVLYIHDPDGRHSLTLRCKDPAHNRVYRLRVGDDDGPVSLLAARFGELRGYFDVVRGDESFTFDVPIRLVGGNRSIITVNEGRRPPPPSEHVRARTQLAPLAVRSLKFVPFVGAGGDAAGVRVTGVKPGSWLEKIGVKPGDVITSWQGAGVTAPSDLLRRAEAEALPRAVVVKRGVATGNAQTITLRQS